MRCDCGSIVRMNTTIHEQPSGETFTDEWYVCPYCSTTWTEDELAAIQE